MVPTYTQAISLWKTYNLPEHKQRHCLLVAKLALFFASKIKEKIQTFIQTDVLLAAALLHDIDKNIPPKEGELHPDTGVRILKEIGMDKVANVIRTHPLHAILDDTIAPSAWEEKLLFLADKMTKHETISVDARFALWRAEELSKEEVSILDAAYPKVKELEQFVCTTIGLTPDKVIELVKQSILGDKGELL
ncbi:MAG: hypothetical protein UT26_C0016G0002 [Microgenomates group bacterium GW2011_GWC1_39_12]|nr:MAG: hypothetical protein UT26_C0016G0002 [Microgenomates group bacterium GW2011_GWC1_39_12]